MSWLSLAHCLTSVSLAAASHTFSNRSLSDNSATALATPDILLSRPSRLSQSVVVKTRRAARLAWAQAVAFFSGWDGAERYPAFGGTAVDCYEGTLVGDDEDP